MEELEAKLREWGASFAGYSSMQDGGVPGMQSLRSAITIGIHLSELIVDGIADRPTFTYFHHYRTVNALIDQICLRGLLIIQDFGYDAVAVPASQTVNDVTDGYRGLFPHKTAAVRSGLGWIGRNGLFISNDYGPRVRLGTILTDMPLPVYREQTGNELSAIAAKGCGSCRSCVESCPAMALTGNLWQYGCNREQVVDARACSEYMNSKFKHIGRGSVCGICMRVCPHRHGKMSK